MPAPGPRGGAPYFLPYATPFLYFYFAQPFLHPWYLDPYVPYGYGPYGYPPYVYPPYDTYAPSPPGDLEPECDPRSPDYDPGWCDAPADPAVPDGADATPPDGG